MTEPTRLPGESLMEFAARYPAAEAAADVIEFRVTFGQKEARETHPRYAAAHPDGWLTVLAPDELTARQGVINAITNRWSSIYRPGDEGYPTQDGYYSRGELGRLQATEGPGQVVYWRWLDWQEPAW